MCTPTRYSLLTGRYAWRTNVREGVLAAYGKSMIPKERLTLASLLQSEGYRTGSFGKWHLGLDWVPVAGDPGDFHWGTQVRAKGTVGMLSRRVDHSKPVTLGPTHPGFDTSFIKPSNTPRVPLFIRDDRVIGNPQRDERWKLILDTIGSGGDTQATPGFEPLISLGPWQFDDPVTGQLYDLENDPYETTDLFEQHPGEVSRLLDILTEAVDSGRSR